MPRLELALGFRTGEPPKSPPHRRHPPPRRKKPPPRRRRAAAAPPVGPGGASGPDPTPREEDDETWSSEAAHSSFSYSLRECQKQRQLRAEAIASGRRPVSVELNGSGGGAIDLAVLSPRCLPGSGLGGMSKSSTASSRSRSGTFPSPGTPNYHGHCATGMQYPKGWSSERVPLAAGSNRRCGGSGVVLPFNNGRKLPSKWEDAEKWILSPVSGDGAGRLSAPAPHHRRPKSKSGPLGHPGGVPGAYAVVSPLVPCFDGVLAAANFAANSPFSAGVLMAERGSNGDCSSGRGRCGGGDDGSSRSYSTEKEPCIIRSASIHVWTDTLMEASSSTHISEETNQDDKIHRPRAAAPMVSNSILKKDVSTQMSPEGSTPSSPKGRPSVPSGNPIKEPNSLISRLEVRDVQIDDQVTVTRWSKRHVSRGSDKRSTNIVEWRKKTVEARAPSFDEKERERCISKCKREEAKITAWENLQKAKAEAAIRNLEMKLEKKRSSSMDKILNKLRSAQKRAQVMRSAVSVDEDRCGVSATKRSSYFGRTGRSFSSCFTCHAC